MKGNLMVLGRLYTIALILMYHQQWSNKSSWLGGLWGQISTLNMVSGASIEYDKLEKNFLNWG